MEIESEDGKKHSRLPKDKLDAVELQEFVDGQYPPHRTRSCCIENSRRSISDALLTAMIVKGRPQEFITRWDSMCRCIQSLCIERQSFSQLMLAETWDGEFHVLHIRKLDDDDVDGTPNHADEETPPNFSIGQRVVVQ